MGAYKPLCEPTGLGIPVNEFETFNKHKHIQTTKTKRNIPKCSPQSSSPPSPASLQCVLPPLSSSLKPPNPSTSQASPLSTARDVSTAINAGGGTCAAPEEVRGPIEGYGGCTGGLVDGCCTIDTSDENHSYSWWALTTSGDHGTMQVFSDEHCSEDASPVVDWKEGACVDTNGSGKLIKSIRTTQ